MFGKLENGALKYAPPKVRYGDNIIFNPSSTILIELGYLPVAYTDMPADAPEGQHYEPGWQQTDTGIVQAWELADDPEMPEPELTAEEALSIIMGAAE